VVEMIHTLATNAAPKMPATATHPADERDAGWRFCCMG
jgi:hypothetical protein